MKLLIGIPVFAICNVALLMLAVTGSNLIVLLFSALALPFAVAMLVLYAVKP